MFLRRRCKTVKGARYDYWSLCEAVRTAAGPRQRVVASLGKLTGGNETRPAAGSEDLRALLGGRPAARQMHLGEKPPPATTLQPQWEVADVAALRVDRVRDFGEPWLGLALWHRLGLHTLLAQLIEPGKEDVPWVDIARFCAQRSEPGIAEHWYERTALEDITGNPPEKINDDRLYRGLDVLAAHKDKLCAHLMDRYRDWFGIRFEFDSLRSPFGLPYGSLSRSALLYDVTSTFFEGQAEDNDKAARGYSRDRRSDCKQVCIGLACSPEGLPLPFEVFAGNRTDVTTVEEIVTVMDNKCGQAERVWVMD